MIRLVGAPERVLADVEALDEGVEEQISRLGLPVVRVDDHGITLGAVSVAVFGRIHAYVPNCTAWYVGPGPCPGWMRATDGRGPATAHQVLATLATALEQERAGVAFRAASAGAARPSHEDFDVELLEGVARAVAPSVPPTELLLGQSLAAIERCCASSGAIAAAPRPADGGPDYGFTWQRDAAAVGFALHALAERGPADLQTRAARRLQAYVGFLSRLNGDLSASRRTLDGQVVGGYGDPQHDGPAASALLLQAIAPALATPFVDHLVRIGDAPGYDLWELTEGHHFHAEHLRRRALLNAGIHSPEPREPPLDAAVIGSTVLGGVSDPADLTLTRPVADKLLDAALLWPVNTRWRLHHAHGAGVGRFPRDANDGVRSTGGGPWPVCTLWLAQHYRASGLHAHSDGLLAFTLAHIDPTGISEQIHPDTGQPRGARGLAWAHAELITTLLQAGRGEAT